MLSYILKRLLLIVPTLVGIVLVNFLIIQTAPGGPVEQTIAKLQGIGAHTNNAFSQQQDLQSDTNAYGLPDDVLADINRQFGFDKPLYERFFSMLADYARFDFGESFYRSTSVIDLILEKMPVSISLGLWSTLLIYLISIPLGIKKAIKHGSRFDYASSLLITVAYAIPGFLFAIFLIVFFAGGNYFSWFPLRGLSSDNFDQLSVLGQIKDYFWHITLPVLAFSISGFAQLTLLTKNSFLEEINKQYVTTAYAKGLNDKQVLFQHIFRNAMLIIIAGFPAAFVSLFFTGSLLIEVIFSLDGLGLLSFEAVLNRDYPIIFGTLFIFTGVSLLLKLLSDLVYVWVDPRINFNAH